MHYTLYGGGNCFSSSPKQEIKSPLPGTPAFIGEATLWVGEVAYRFIE
jgi:hypothetical protein